VLGHLGINVPDLVEAKAYYDVLLPMLGFEPFLSAADEFAYRPAGRKAGTYLFFYPSTEPGPYARTRTGLQHLAFMAPTRARVREVNATAVELGSELVHPPQHWPRYPPPYYAAFWLDPFGLMIEVVCHKDR
jgi:catechol 2,3-dioxygenase-like lactoylglutathione lyase family enzyme